MRIKGFIWDRFNIEKCQKHEVGISQIEEFLLQDPFVVSDDAHSGEETRFIAFGYYSERFVFVVFTIRVSGRNLKFRVISARYARGKEIERLHQYEEEKSKAKIKSSK